jgi:hypothetical protein
VKSRVRATECLQLEHYFVPCDRLVGGLVPGFSDLKAEFCHLEIDWSMRHSPISKFTFYSTTTLLGNLIAIFGKHTVFDI